MRRASKRGRDSILLQPIDEQIHESKKVTKIPNSYVEEIKRLYHEGELPLASIDGILSLFKGGQLHFLIELWEKMSIDDMKQFLMALVLVEKGERTFLIEKGKKVQHLHILLEGEVHYGIKSDLEEEQIKVGSCSPGFVVYPEFFMTPRYVNLSVFCQTDCSFLAISEETYNKYIKKLMAREMDALTHFLAEVPIFSGVGVLTMRKYAPYFFPRAHKYNETIYSTGDSSEEIFIVVDGQVQISTKKGNTQVNLVNLSSRECFGINVDETMHRNNIAKSKHSDLKVLVLSRYILDIIQAENPCVFESCESYKKGTEKLHHQLLNKNITALSKSPTCTKIKRKKKRKPQQSETSLAWWGLAHNIKTEHKYMLMNPHLAKEYQDRSSLYNGKSPRLPISHKIAELRRRVEGNGESEEEDEKENSPWKKDGYIPKIKTRVRLLEVKPKAIDMAENVKKKLVTYAKNMNSFCERLDFE